MNHAANHQSDAWRMPVLLVTLLFALWAVTAATWLFDSAGYSAGMPMPLFFVHLAAPLLVGLLVGRQKTSLRQGMKSGMIAGALFGAADIGAQLIWGAVLFSQGKISPDQPFSFAEGLFEVVEFLALFTVVGLILGLVGGLLGAALGGRVHRSGA